MRGSCIPLGITNVTYQLCSHIHYMKLKPFNTLTMKTKTTTLHLRPTVSQHPKPISRVLETNSIHRIYHNPQRERILNVELHLNRAIPEQLVNTMPARLRDGETTTTVRINGIGDPANTPKDKVQTTLAMSCRTRRKEEGELTRTNTACAQWASAG